MGAIRENSGLYYHLKISVSLEGSIQLVYMEVAKSVNLKRSHYKKNMFFFFASPGDDGC